MSADLFKTSFSQFFHTLFAHTEAVLFIRKYKIWEGFWKYGWVSRILIGLAILLGLKFIDIFWEFLEKFNNSEGISAFVEMGQFVGNMAIESYSFLFTGGIKYVMLLLLEVIIFHVCRRCLEILNNQTIDLSFKNFMKAQIRMIKVVIRSYFMEMFYTVLLKIFFGIFGSFDFLESFLIFGVQCYFLGFLVLDNYLEQFKLSIKESVRYAKQYIGVSLAVGFVLNILLLVPIIGVIVAPIIAAITVSLVMYRIADLHLHSAKISSEK